MDKEQMEEAFAFVTRITGVNKKDLVSATKENEYTSFKDLLKAIEPTVRTHNEEKHEELKGKYTRQAHTKTERLLKDSLSGFKFTTSKQKDMFAELGAHLETIGQSQEEKPITLTQALQVEGMDEYIKTKQESYVDDHMTKFEQKQKVRDYAVAKLKELNANLSADPKRSQRQIDIVAKYIEDNHNIDFTGDSPIVLDKNGEKIMNSGKTAFIGFEDVIKQASPVDFLDGTHDLNTPPNPKGESGLDNNNFGFTSNELKVISIDEFEQARRENNPEKADFILKQMELNEYGGTK